MIIYEPWTADGYQLLLPDDEFRTVRAPLEAVPGCPAGDRWKIPRVQLIKEDVGRPLLPADLPKYSTDVMAVNTKARTALEGIVSADVEFLPLDCDEEDLWLLHPWRLVDALDLTKCDVKLFSSGRIMAVTRYFFQEDKIRGLTCFMVPQLAGQMFVNDAVVAAVRGAELTGMTFRKLWQSR